MSTHATRVVKIDAIKPHPNADSLSLTDVNGWQVIIRTGDFTVGELAVFVEPDYCVPIEHPAFKFLEKNSRYNLVYARLKAVRLRQEISYGLLVPLRSFPELAGVQEGDDVMEKLGIIRYEPSMPKRAGLGGDAVAYADLPTTIFPMTVKFDLENLKHYKNVIEPGELVVVTEKIHGANGRFMGANGHIFCGSRGHWLKEDDAKPCAWWKAFRGTPGMEELLRAFDRVIFYGEVYGRVQSLRYGRPDSYNIALFAAYDTNNDEYWATSRLLEVADMYGVPRVPALANPIPYDFDAIKALAEQPSTLAAINGVEQISEGVVVTPYHPRRDPRIGRVSLKLISDAYWLSNND